MFSNRLQQRANNAKSGVQEKSNVKVWHRAIDPGIRKQEAMDEPES